MCKKKIRSRRENYINGKYHRIVFFPGFTASIWNSSYSAISMPIKSHRQRRSLNLSLPLQKTCCWGNLMLNTFNISNETAYNWLNFISFYPNLTLTGCLFLTDVLFRLVFISPLFLVGRGISEILNITTSISISYGEEGVYILRHKFRFYNTDINDILQNDLSLI